MASLDTVGDRVGIRSQYQTSVITVEISGTYDMAISLRASVGSPEGGSWQIVKTWDVPDATVSEAFVNRGFDNVYELIVDEDTSGTAVATVEEAFEGPIIGTQGPQGEPGPEGPQGPQGPPGLDGADGADGADGLDELNIENNEVALPTKDTLNFADGLHAVTGAVKNVVRLGMVIEGDGASVSFENDDVYKLDFIGFDSVVKNSRTVEVTAPSGSGSTNITVTEAPTNVEIASSSGTNDTIALADTNNAGVMSPGHFDKLEAIEALADVTDTAKVTAAGALMDSEVTNLADVKSFDPADYATAAQGATADSAQQPPTEGAFVDGDKTKLDGIASGAEVNRALSSQAEAEAGTDNVKGMTPLRTAQAIAALETGGNFTVGDTQDQVTSTIEDGGNLSGSVAAVTIDFNSQSGAEITLTGDLTGSFVGITGLADSTTVGKVYNLWLTFKQDGTGGRTFPQSVFDNFDTVSGDLPIIDTTATTGRVEFMVEARVVTGPSVETTIYLGPKWRPVDISGTYQIKPTDVHSILRSGADATLPLGNDNIHGRHYLIENYSGGEETPATLSSQTFDLSAAIPDGERRGFAWDKTDTEWKVV